MIRRAPMRKPGLNLVQRAVIAAQWRQDRLDADIHALIGEDSDKLVNLAGRMFFVAVSAAVASGLAMDHPDARIVRGAVNAVCDQAGAAFIPATRRASIISGLQAVSRLIPLCTTRAVTDAACDLAMRLRYAHVHMSDFEQAAG